MRPSINFVERSNRKAQEKQRWCKKHPKSFWGPDYSQCVQGYRKGEECEEGQDEQ